MSRRRKLVPTERLQRIAFELVAIAPGAPAEGRGYGPILAGMVEAGRISVRRAEALTEAKIDGNRACPAHGAGCEAWS